jgi:AsmA protein
MKKLLITLGGLVALLVIAVLVVPPLIPTAAYKRQLLHRISAATGRTVQINGKFGFTILPELGFFADKVALANAPGATPANMVTIDKLSLRAALMPLLSGNMVVHSFVLDKPVIHLSVDKSGRPNWRFVEQSARPAPAAGTRGAGGRGALGFLRKLTLGDVRIVDGKVRYANARSGARDEADAVNVKLSLPSLDKPMAVDGSLVWHKEKIALVLHLADPGALLADKPAAIDADITAKLLGLSFKGTLKAGQPVTANGTLAVDVPSVRQLAAWTGSRLHASGSTFGRLKLHGKAALAGANIALRQAVFSLDAIQGDGDVRFDDAGAHPYVTAKLMLGTVDLNPYLPAPSTAPAPAPGARPAPARTPAPQGWSTAPVDLAPLMRVDGEFDLTLAGLLMRKWALGPSHTSISLKGGRLVVDLDRMALYGGKANARMTLNATAAPGMILSCNLSHVQLKPLLAAAAGRELLEGTASLSLQVTGQGHSRHDIVSTLSGSGRIDVRNGAIQGVDLVGIIRSAASALNNLSAAHMPAVTGSSETTAFSQLSGSYTIRNGVLFNNDLSMQSSLFRANGRGSVNLVRGTVDYRLEVKPYSPPSIRIGGVTMSQFAVPVIVTGPWDDPSYRPDLAAILRDIAKGKVLKGLEKKIPGGKAGKGLGGALRQLLGH